MYGPLGRLSGKYGRRSMMVVLTVLIILNSLCLIGAYKLAIGFTAPLLLLWLVLASATGPWEIDIMTVMYVVDTTATKKRTSMLSVVMGCAYVAGIPAFAIGGWLTTWTQDDAVVYWAVIGIALFLLAYIAFILPESFDHARREKLASEWKNERERSGRGTGYLNSALETFFQHLTLLKPHRDPVTGRWNLRLLWCGVHAFLSALASGYLINSILIYLALHMRYKPDENGYTLTVSAIATGFSLIIVTPLLIKWGRHFYGFAYKHTTNPSVKRDTRNSLINAKLDKHLAIFGWTIDILSMAFLPLARTRMQVTISLMVLGASYFRISTFRCVVVASGDSIRSGEILAAIQTLTALGTALSGLVLGSVLSASIDTFPGLVFLVYSAIAFVSVVALCLIKDSDRYIAPLATDS
ncbi:major facilitator superfamily domain-containing protein [Mycena sp. CBHHK59/15]|nr:major facilitator superfamily domain-containing protein [Mycena sp. CBHHK59/15]